MVVPSSKLVKIIFNVKVETCDTLSTSEGELDRK